MSNTLTVSLTPELKDLVIAKVRSGRYGNASEVIREALRNWELGHEVEDPELEAAIVEGLQSPLLPGAKPLSQLIRRRRGPKGRRG